MWHVYRRAGVTWNYNISEANKLLKYLNVIIIPTQLVYAACHVLKKKKKKMLSTKKKAPLVSSAQQLISDDKIDLAAYVHRYLSVMAWRSTRLSYCKWKTMKWRAK